MNLGVPVLVLAALLSGGGVVVIGVAETRTPPRSPLILHAPCDEKTGAGPTRLFYCADGHAYVHQDSGWVDVGRRTRVPSVPRS